MTSYIYCVTIHATSVPIHELPNSFRLVTAFHVKPQWFPVTTLMPVMKLTPRSVPCPVKRHMGRMPNRRPVKNYRHNYSLHRRGR